MSEDYFKIGNQKGEAVGNDGLTDRQRSAFAEHYRQTVCAPLTEQEVADARDWLIAKRRMTTNNGNRHSLDDVVAELGIDPDDT